MFGIGGFELFIILLFGFLIFGPDKLPEIARTAGEAIGKFKKAKDEMDAVLHDEILDPDAMANARPRTSQVAQRAAEEPAAAPQPVVKESFAERKARYERERAAEQRRAEQERSRQDFRADGARKAKETSSVPADASSSKPRPSAAELYGLKPSKPAPASQAADTEQEA